MSTFISLYITLTNMSFKPKSGWGMGRMLVYALELRMVPTATHRRFDDILTSKVSFSSKEKPFPVCNWTKSKSWYTSIIYSTYKFNFGFFRVKCALFTFLFLHNLDSRELHTISPDFFDYAWSIARPGTPIRGGDSGEFDDPGVENVICVRHLFCHARGV